MVGVPSVVALVRLESGSMSGSSTDECRGRSPSSFMASWNSSNSTSWSSSGTSPGGSSGPSAGTGTAATSSRVSGSAGSPGGGSGCSSPGGVDVATAGAEDIPCSGSSLVLMLLELGDLDVQHDLLRGVQHPGRSPDAPHQIDLPSGHRQRELHLHDPVGSAASSCVMVEVPGVV